MTRTIKLIGMNIIVVGFLFFVMNFSSVIAVKIYNWAKPNEYSRAHLLPNYRNVSWAEDHFAEFQQLKSQYEAYYGWRYMPFDGKTIRLDENGLRSTFKDGAANPAQVIAFFGGSTTFGTGVLDDQTIPSFFVKMNQDFAAINFGQHGYVAHQSLNVFLKQYFEGLRPDFVVFYDGVNDIGKCRSELGPYAHAREVRIRTVLKETSSEHPESYAFLIQPTKNFIAKLLRLVHVHTQRSFFDCDKDRAKAEMVARVLLSDWLVAKKMVESYGGEFIAILQPTAHLSETKKNHFELDPEVGRQYETVYPLIADLLKEEFSALEDNFVDLRQALDIDEYVFFDSRHLSPNGNRIIASHVSQAVRQRIGSENRLSGSVRSDSEAQAVTQELR